VVDLFIEGGASGFGGGQPPAEMGLHPADPLLVGTAVQAVPARRTHRLEQAVAALPRAQQVLVDLHATRKFPDAQDRRIALTRHDPEPYRPWTSI